MNYTNPSSGWAGLAIIRVPSLFPTTSPSYQGPLIINPGGPGGSGVSLILRSGIHFSTILDGRFDIIGLDPRGKYHVRLYCLKHNLLLSRDWTVKPSGQVLQDVLRAGPLAGWRISGRFKLLNPGFATQHSSGSAHGTLGRRSRRRDA